MKQIGPVGLLQMRDSDSDSGPKPGLRGTPTLHPWYSQHARVKLWKNALSRSVEIDTVYLFIVRRTVTSSAIISSKPLQTTEVTGCGRLQW